MLLEPQPPSVIQDGAPGLVVFPALLSLYGAFAFIQNAYRPIPLWRPSWPQGLLVMWVVGLVAPLLVDVVRAGLTNGPAAARDAMGFALVVWGFLIVLPGIFVAMWAHRARTNDERAFLDP
jgi:hypothetical protein